MGVERLQWLQLPSKGGRVLAYGLPIAGGGGVLGRTGVRLLSEPARRESMNGSNVDEPAALAWGRG
jgi:hypothetical protein